MSKQLKLQEQADNSDLKARVGFISSSQCYIATLPPETLGDIFERCSPPIEIWSKTPPSQLQLSWVCQNWRVIMLAHYNVWSSLRINVDLAPGIDEDAKANTLGLRLDKYLHLSGEVPITFNLFCNAQSSPGLVRLASRKLCMHCRRWKSISLRISSPLFLQVMVEQVHSLPALESLSISSKWTALVASVMEQAPNLTHLSLTNVNKPLDCFSVPWMQLTHFHSCNVVYEDGEFLRRLEAMPQLTELVFIDVVHIPAAENRTTSAGDPLTTVLHAVEMQPQMRSLNYLRNLRILVSDISIFGDILDHIKAPALRILSMSFVRRTQDNEVAQRITPLLERSACALESIYLTMLPVTDTIEILKAAPTISTLYCYGILGLFKLLTQLIVVPGNAPLVANLQHLQLADSSQFRHILDSNPHISPTMATSKVTQSLLDVLRSRTQCGVQPLRRAAGGNKSLDGACQALKSFELKLVKLDDVDLSNFDVLADFGSQYRIRMEVVVEESNRISNRPAFLRIVD